MLIMNYGRNTHCSAISQDITDPQRVIKKQQIRNFTANFKSAVEM